MTCACDLASGSSCACAEKTDSSVWRKRGFSVKEPGVGGSLVVVPIAWAGVVGEVGRSDKTWLLSWDVFGNTY